jgi:hypothetical protein
MHPKAAWDRIFRGLLGLLAYCQVSLRIVHKFHILFKSSSTLAKALPGGPEISRSKFSHLLIPLWFKEVFLPCMDPFAMCRAREMLSYI